MNRLDQRLIHFPYRHPSWHPSLNDHSAEMLPTSKLAPSDTGELACDSGEIWAEIEHPTAP